MCRAIHRFQFTNIFLLSSYFISLSASGSGVTVRVQQRELNGTVTHSVLLPVSYSTLTPYSALNIQWLLFPGQTPFVSLIRSSCSRHPDRPGYNCSDRTETGPSYRHRVHLYPGNGSLLLRDLQPSDSGVYVITVYANGENAAREDNVTLTIYNQTESETPAPSTPESTQTNTTQKSPEIYIYISASVVCPIILIILTCLYLLMIKQYRGRQPQQDSVLMETSVQAIAGRMQDLAENEEPTSNSELVYSLLHWTEPRNPLAPGPLTQEQPQETIYAFAQKADCS
ncbi:uncharacterized protein LOC121291131 [Carcharodon carcharias]|uniref:uncharacterized protein LOC121291131 n=1 Tax=Carcharodon carcharias TaxID=13397 RepID=UPI001B7E9309|nr:uncharacterized protein LOC121291131 [Carcharodon carcharias]